MSERVGYFAKRRGVFFIGKQSVKQTLAPARPATSPSSGAPSVIAPLADSLPRRRTRLRAGSDPVPKFDALEK